MPLYHEGNGALMTFVRPVQTDPAQRFVLRAYPSGFALSRGRDALAPLDLIGLTREIVDPLILGFKEVEASDPAENIAGELGAALRTQGLDVRQVDAGGQSALLIVPPQ